MPATKEDYIQYRVKNSQQMLKDAKALADMESWNSCLNRLYYSAYYLVSALLYKNNIKAHTHTGIKTQFNLHFIKDESAYKELGRLYSNLFDWRQESDYADFVDFDEKTVIPLIDEARDLTKGLWS